MVMTVGRHMVGGRNAVMGTDAKEVRESQRMTVSGHKVRGHIFKSLVSFTKAKTTLPLPLCER